MKKKKIFGCIKNHEFVYRFVGSIKTDKSHKFKSSKFMRVAKKYSFTKVHVQKLISTSCLFPVGAYNFANLKPSAKTGLRRI